MTTNTIVTNHAGVKLPQVHEVAPKAILRVVSEKVANQKITIQKKRAQAPTTQTTHSPAEYLFELQNQNPNNKLIQNFKFTGLSENPVQAREQMIQQLQEHSLWEQTHNSTGKTVQRNLLNLPHANEHTNVNVPSEVTDANVNWPQMLAEANPGTGTAAHEHLLRTWSQGLPTQEKLAELHQQARSVGIQLEEGQGLTANDIQNAQKQKTDEHKKQIAAEIEQILKSNSTKQSAYDSIFKGGNLLNASYDNVLETLEIMSGEKAIEALRKDGHTDLADKLSQLKAGHPDLTGLQELDKQLAQHNHDLEQLEHERQLAILHGHHKTAEQLASINQEIQKLETTIREAKADNSETQSQEIQLKNLQQKQAELTQELQPIALQYAEEHNSTLEKAVSEKDKTIDSLKNQNQALEKDNGEYWGVNATLGMKNQALEKELQETKGKLQKQQTETSGDLWQQLKNVQWDLSSTAMAGVIGLLSMTGLLNLFNSLFSSSNAQTSRATQYANQRG